MAGIKTVGHVVMFVVGGIIAIIVGSFMIRGTMHLWDKPQSDSDKEKNSNNDNFDGSEK